MKEADLAFKTIETCIPFMSKSEKVGTLIQLEKLKDKVKKKHSPAA